MGRRLAISPSMMMGAHLEIDSLVDPHEREKKLLLLSAVETKEPIARRDMMRSGYCSQSLRMRFLISIVWEPVSIIEKA